MYLSALVFIDFKLYDNAEHWVGLYTSFVTCHFAAKFGIFKSHLCWHFLRSCPDVIAICFKCLLIQNCIVGR